MSMPEITVAELRERRERGAVLLDVRNPDEFVWARIPGAVLIPLSELVERAAEVPTTGEVLVVCKVGGRSAVAVDFLRGLGVDAVNVAGGTLAWIEAGHEVDTGWPVETGGTA